MNLPLDQPLLPSTETPTPAPDAELSQVAEELLKLDPRGERIASVLRATYDLLLDGQHTGRYKWSELYKTEKTHFGTLLEINLQREFGFADGDAMDFAIRGIDVDCKFSERKARWMIPPEAMGHILLGLWASDEKGIWSAGLVRVHEDHLSTSKGNRDRKRNLSAKGRDSIHWLFEDRPLPENVLLRIPPKDVDVIFNCSPHGTKRVDMLFRLAHQRPIRRAVVATVAQQEDYMKRVRGNGGSRSSLRPEGIVILGQYTSHAAIADALGLPVPGPGEFVSVRLARHTSDHADAPSVLLEGTRWVVARPDDPVESAPKLPKVKKKGDKTD
ncbi:NaeI family type II restriction endonuclease [Spirillospora sp. NPDC052269]